MTIESEPIQGKDKLRSRLIRRLLRFCARHENNHGDYFTTFHQRPKRSGRIGTWPEPDCSSEGCSVVMQGPVALQDDFTFETLRIYRRNMPKAELILSTWKDENQPQLSKIADLGVTILQNDKPDVPGLSNINMQIVTAAAGVRLASRNGARWIMKTRTDQRLYEPNLISFLIGLTQSFPLIIQSKQYHRIIGIGHGSLKFVPYHVTDQTLFGDARDMLIYWTPSLQDKNVVSKWSESREEVYLNYSIGELCKEASPESYLASKFLIKMGHEPDWSIPDSWRAYRDHFCFVDYGTTDFYWLKHQSNSLAELNKTYIHVSNRQEMNFLEWMLLYSQQLKPGNGNLYSGVLKDKFLGLIRL